jgi:hypothetical protein
MVKGGRRMEILHQAPGSAPRDAPVSGPLRAVSGPLRARCADARPWEWDRPKGVSRAPKPRRGSLSVTDMPPAGRSDSESTEHRTRLPATES